MGEISLASVDLNLLVTLEILLEERSVSKAAARLHVTQPAVSQSLGKLRRLFGDPLLVRAKGRMEPTPKAIFLQTPLRAVLSQIRRVLEEEPEFVPETSEAEFRVAASDYTMTALFPSVVADVQREAPLIGMRILPIPPHRVFEALEDGSVDLGVGVFAAPPSFLREELLYEEGFLSMVRKGHPILRKRRSVEAFASYPHGLVTTTGEGEGIVDRVLREKGRKRRIAIRIPYFMSVPTLLPKTDLIFTMPEKTVLRLSRFYGLAAFSPPLSLPPFPVRMVWSPRLDAVPAHQWFRSQIRGIAQKGLS